MIFDGAGNHRLFDVMASRYHIFEGLTIRNTDVAFFAGQKEVCGAVGLTVKNCRFENIGFGVWTEYAGSSDFYIADNLFLGRDDRFRLVGWTGPLWASAGPYGSHQLTSYYAIKLYGPGHVIAHNAIAYFHDALGISTYGTPENDPERQASSIDIYNNDIHMSNDDFIGDRRQRAQCARLRKSGHQCRARRIQLAAGIRRTDLLHPQHPLQRSDRSGVQVFRQARRDVRVSQHDHRRADSRDPYSNAHWRNNLFMGRDTPDRGVMAWANATDAYSSDYNGFRPNKGVAAQYTWLGAESTASSLYEPKPENWKTFATLADFRAGDRAGDSRHRSRFRCLREAGSAGSGASGTPCITRWT